MLLSLDGGTVTGTVKVPTGDAALSTNSASLGGESRQSSTPAAPAQIVGAVVFLPEVWLVNRCRGGECGSLSWTRLDSSRQPPFRLVATRFTRLKIPNLALGSIQNG